MIEISSKCVHFDLVHREEGNRIIREFLMGERNIEYITQGLKSDK
jgi:hypothetical protein